MSRSKKNGKMIEQRPVEKISDSEHAVIAGLKVEVEQLKKRQQALQKELTLVSADLYRKGDELEVKIREIAEKYGLKKGERELVIRTGEILRRG